MNIAEYYQKHPEGVAPTPAEPENNNGPDKAAKPGRLGNKGLWACAIGLLVLILLSVSCPSSADHKEALGNAARDYFAHQGEAEDEWQQLTSMLSSGVAKMVIDQRLTVKKYLVFSLGRIDIPDQGTKTVSVGVMGHVFTPSEQQLDRAVKGFSGQI